MKNIKKLIALTCVAAMLVPTLAYASDGQTTPEEVKMTGDSVVETDNSKEYEYTSVVLPTTNDSTYAFQIDRDGLLPKYDSANTYESGATVYFHAENDAASIALVNDTDYKLVEIGKEVDIATGAAADAIAASQLADALVGKVVTDLPADTFYVWTPVITTDNGLGQWTALTTGTDGNIENYLKLTLDTDSKVTAIELQADPLSGTNIWDGNIYVVKYDEVTDGAKAVVDYNVKADTNNAITSMDAGLYAYDTTNDTYTAIDKDNAATHITYTAATDWYAGTADEATVYNKSTTPIAVSVDVKVTAEGLTFNQTGSYTDDTAASVSFTVGDGTNEATIDENGAATVYYVLDEADNGYETFQGSTYDIETGSHNYYKYEQPNATYDSQSFVITATANAEDDSDDAWEEYIKAVEDKTVVRPTIEVVYNWIEVEEKDAATFKYEDENGAVYTATSATDGWVTGGFTPNTTLSLTSAKDKVYFMLAPNATVTSSTLYEMDDYISNGANATSVADLKSSWSVAASGNCLIAVETLKTKAGAAGDYVIVVVSDGKTYVTAYTVED